MKKSFVKCNVLSFALQTSAIYDQEFSIELQSFLETLWYYLIYQNI